MRKGRVGGDAHTYRYILSQTNRWADTHTHTHVHTHTHIHTCTFKQLSLSLSHLAICSYKPIDGDNGHAWGKGCRAVRVLVGKAGAMVCGGHSANGQCLP